MKLLLPLFALIIFVGCADKDAPAQDDTVAVSKESGAQSADDTGDLTGTWKLVEQKGYGPDHPDDVEQTLTFDGERMTNVQSALGRTSEMVLTYHVEGEHIKASLESMKLGDEPVNVGEGMPEQTYLWRIDGGRLILEAAETGRQDVYVRAD